MEQIQASLARKNSKLLRAPPGEPQIIIGVHKDLHIQQGADFLNVQDQNALNDDHICWLNPPHFRRALVRREVIDGHIHRPHVLHDLSTNTEELHFAILQISVLQCQKQLATHVHH